MLIGSVIKEHYFFIGQETIDKLLIKIIENWFILFGYGLG